MSRFAGRAVGKLRDGFGAVRRRPWRALLAGLAVTLVVGPLALYGYVWHQWRDAKTALAENRAGEARRRLAMCLAVWPWSAELHRLAARAARVDGDLAATEAHLTRSLKLQGEATEAVQLEFLLLRVQRGELDELTPALIDLVENAHPESPVILDTLARAYILRLRYKPAYACLSRWIEVRPDAARAYQWRGWVLERLNNHKQAAVDYHRALDLAPDLVPPRLRVAEMLIEDKQAPEALPHLERLYRQEPENPLVRSRLGICRFLQGETQEARRLMEGVAAELPNDPVLLVHLARLDLQDQRYADAERWLAKVLSNDPSDVEARYTMISVYQLQGRAEDANRALTEYEGYKAKVERVNKLLKDVVDSPTAGPDDFAEIGEMLLHIGRDQLGTYWLESALERAPGHQRSHRVLAAYFERKGDAASAAGHRRHLRDAATPKSARTASAR